MDFNVFFKSKAFKWISYALGALIVLFLVFGAGMAVGFRKAHFSYRWVENGRRNMGNVSGLRGGFFREMMGRDFTDAHGAAGSVVKIDAAAGASTFVMKDGYGNEKVVVVGGETLIKSSRDTVPFSELKVNDRVIVIGEPDEDGQIEAKLIRLMPMAIK